MKTEYMSRAIEGLYKSIGALAIGAAIALSTTYARGEAPCDIDPPYNIWGTADIDGTDIPDGIPTRVYVNGIERPNISDQDTTIGGNYDAIVSACYFAFGDYGFIDFGNPLLPLYPVIAGTVIMDSPNNTTEDNRIYTMRLRMNSDDQTIEHDPIFASHDIIRGDVNNLAFSLGTVDLGPVTCLGDNNTSGSVIDSTVPAVGQAFFYLAGPASSPPGNYGYASGPNNEPRVRGSLAGDCAP